LIDWFITRSDTINFDEQYSNRVQVRKSDATFQIKFFNCIDAETKPFFLKKSTASNIIGLQQYVHS
jgi:hypothetical protein